MINSGTYIGLAVLGLVFLSGIVFYNRKCKKEVKVYGENQITNPGEGIEGGIGGGDGGRAGDGTGRGQLTGTTDGFVAIPEQRINVGTPGEGRLEQVGIGTEIQTVGPESVSNNEQPVEQSREVIQTSEPSSETVTSSEQDSVQEEIDIPEVEDL